MKKYRMTLNFLKSSYIGFQQICYQINAKRKINIAIFTIWNIYSPSGPEVISVRSHTSLRVFTA